MLSKKNMLGKIGRFSKSFRWFAGLGFLQHISIALRYNSQSQYVFPLVSLTRAGIVCFRSLYERSEIRPTLTLSYTYTHYKDDLE